MTLVDYSANFWGEKHIGYHVLYENLKKGEDTIQDLSNFVKERMGVEDDMMKFLHKSINRVNNYASAGGALIDSWRLTKSMLELWAEIQSSLLKNLADLSKDVIKYHDDLVKSRKRVREYDVLDAVNLMQTTTTCLQKAKETYHQRCAEAMNLKNEAATAKEFLKAKNKLTKAHDEYRAYVEKYNHVRNNFEEKMYKSTTVFQNHDSAHLQQIKDFFVVYARALDEAHSAVAQILLDYRRTLESTDITSIMQRFIMEKGTGTRPPNPIVWMEADEIPAELEVYAASLTAAAASAAIVSAPSSSNSSAIVASTQPQAEPPNVNDLLGINDGWPPASIRNVSESAVDGDANDNSDFDNDDDGAADLGGGSLAATASSGGGSSYSSYVPQFSSWFGRQRLTQWRKKNSASQSNLPAVTGGGGAFTASSTTATVDSSAGTTELFSASYNNHDSGIGGMASSALKGGNYLKRRYRKSVNDLTLTSNKEFSETSDRKNSIDMGNSDDMTPSQIAMSVPTSTNLFDFTNVWDTLEQHRPPPVPGSEPPALSLGGDGLPVRRISLASSSTGGKRDGAGPADESSLFGATDWSSTTTTAGGNSSTTSKSKRRRQNRAKDPWALGPDDGSSTSSSEEDDTDLQASKFRSLQIKPLDSASNEKMNTSVDELRNVVKHMTLERSNTFDKDPWTSDSFMNSLNAAGPSRVVPLRAALTGDDQLWRKFSSDMDAAALPPAHPMDLTQKTGGGIVRARMRSHTPTAAQLMQIHQSGESGSGGDTNASASAAASFQDSFGNSLNNRTGFSAIGSLNSVFDANRTASTSSPLNFGVAPSVPARPLLAAANGSGAVVATVPQQFQQKLPLAMALNEYVHVWFPKYGAAPVMRVFGTVMISLPTSLLPFLADTSGYEIGALRFCLRNTGQVKSILPNQKLLEASDQLDSRASSYAFRIERSTLAQWLAAQQKSKPASTFHNVDIVRYELEDAPGTNTFAPPLRVTAYWRCDATHTDLRVDYALNTDAGLAVVNPLLNIQFSTVVDGRVESVHSEPESKWNAETQTISWTLTELTRHGDCSGSLKARLKLAVGPSKPANTHVQFQVSDASASRIVLALEDADSDFALSMVRRKIFAGKYFCEPQIC